MKKIEKLWADNMGRVEVSEIDMSVARMILQVEGPYSPVFYDEKKVEVKRTWWDDLFDFLCSKKKEKNKNKTTKIKQFTFYWNVVKFEYYWISLSHLIKSGGFVFAIQYLAFSLQGMFQSPVFYSFHLMDVVNRFPTLKDVIRSVT